MASPYSLKSGAKYSAALHLSWMESKVATPAMIQGKFEQAGFTDVVCQPNMLYVTGTWPGADQDNVTLPSQVTSVWLLVD